MTRNLARLAMDTAVGVAVGAAVAFMVVFAMNYRHLSATVAVQGQQIAALQHASAPQASLTASTSLCSATTAGGQDTPCVVTGQTSISGALLEVYPSSGSDNQTLELWGDGVGGGAGAPVCWVSAGGSGTAGGLRCASAGGVPFDGAVTSGTDVYHIDAAITPEGTLVLRPCGTSACTETLSAADIAGLNKLERAGLFQLTLSELRGLVRAAEGR
jgi:hypothetical protein